MTVNKRVRIGPMAVVACSLAVLASLTPARAAAAAADPAVVRISDGLIRGAVTGSYREFEGIPYAAPPVGGLRWQPPQPTAPWNGVRDATRPGSECPQQAPRGTAMTGSEDCLFLNVTTPLPEPSGARLPVMAWIHGGGVSGAGSDYDTTRLTTQGDVITVTINYRLGALGFLDVAQLAARDPYAGNYALADQQAALRWVRRNIAAFGGDPGNVTLFGQSFGGEAVCANLAAPGSRGLFQKAIVESAPCGNPLPSARAAEQRSARVAAELGCAPPADVLACLRGEPAAALVNAATASVGPGTPAAGEPWVYVTGTPALPQQPLTALGDGTAAPVPLIQGSNQNEMRILVAGWYDEQGAPLTARQYPAVLAEAFGPGRAQAIATEYPLSRYPSPDIALATVLTDWGGLTGSCPELPADDAASRRAPVYAYEFVQNDGLRIGTFPMGATHGSELPYLFAGMQNFPPPNPALSRQMVSYWTTFARTGNPDSPGTPYWPAYHPGNQTILSLAAGPGGITPIPFAAEHHCGFWGDH
jgi:para-nitrobenzyl esterase